MTEIKYSTIALTNYRADFRKMSREKLAQCSGLSVSSIVRLESATEDDGIIGKTSNDRLAILANCLNIPQHKLWAEIPNSYDFVGTEVKSATELAEIIFDLTTPPSKFIVRGIPENDLHKEYLKDIAKLVDLVETKKCFNSLETLEAQMTIDEGFQALSELTDSAFYKISISTFDVRLLDRELGFSEPVWVAAKNSWKHSVNIAFSSNKVTTGIPLATITPLIGIDEALEHCSRDYILSENKEILECGRSNDIVPF